MIRRPPPGGLDDAGRAADPAAPAAWLAVTLLLLGPAALLFLAPSDLSDRLAWRPGRVAEQPWRAWTAAWVHLSALHLAANLAGAVLVGALGVASRLPRRAALAWTLAWPLTQLGLLAMPALTRYAGLSGVLHAGVAVIAVELIARFGDRRDHRLGLAIAAVLVAKLLLEAPWRGPLAHPPGWDIAVAPLAHATGAIAGALAATAGLRLRRQRRAAA